MIDLMYVYNHKKIGAALKSAQKYLKKSNPNSFFFNAQFYFFIKKYLFYIY